MIYIYLKLFIILSSTNDGCHLSWSHVLSKICTKSPKGMKIWKT